jgi:GrpB-like predicted nucleotidyltransferase (UPF0157 family)
MGPADDRDAYLDAVLIGGREPVEITIVDHDPGWAARYEDVRAGLRAALGDVALGVQHIGSTSVPGLAAKPIIDVLVTVAHVTDEDAYVPSLTRVGYVLRVREDDHRMLQTPAEDVHVHVYEPAHQAVADHVDLRNHLRASETDRDLYADAKRALAQRSWADVNDYADAKTEVILAILTRARGRQGPLPQ